jgi:hypothetical protein
VHIDILPQDNRFGCKYLALKKALFSNPFEGLFIHICTCSSAARQKWTAGQYLRFIGRGATGGYLQSIQVFPVIQKKIVASACEGWLSKFTLQKRKAPRRKDGPLLRLDALISVFTNTFIHLVVVFILAPLIHSKTV